MKTVIKKLVLLILFNVFMAINLFAVTTYMSDEVKKACSLLPIKYKTFSGQLTHDTIFKIDNNGIKSVEIKADKDGNILNIGLYIPSVKMENNYADAFDFIKYCLFNIALINNNAELKNFIERKHLLILYKSRPVNHDITFVKGIPDLINGSSLSITYNNSIFTADIHSSSETFCSIVFPSNINLLRGMDKKDLEDEFSMKINQDFVEIPQRKTFPNAKPFKNNIYVETGAGLFSGHFNSDVYLSNLNGNYYPVFTSDLPVESFSNIFTCNIFKDYGVQLTRILYGNKKVNELISLKKIHSILAENCYVYFGLESCQNNIIKATIIYYNPIYNYSHMLVTEADGNTIFKNNNAVIKGTLYTYIPYVQ